MMMNNTINKKTITIVPIIQNHLDRYPMLTVQDIYKLIYQVAMGPEHLITYKADAYNRLCDELDKIDASFSQAIYEKIDPEDKLVRLNLGPFKQNNGDPEKLFKAFYQTSSIFKPKVENIQFYNKQVYQLTEDKKFAFDFKQMESFFREKESQNFPAVHHSDIYRKSYHPAYRLVLKELLHLLH